MKTKTSYLFTFLLIVCVFFTTSSLQAFTKFDPEQESHYKVYLSYQDANFVLGASVHQVLAPSIYFNAEAGLSMTELLNLNLTMDDIYCHVGTQVSLLGYERVLTPFKSSYTSDTTLNKLFFQIVRYAQ